MFDSLELTVFSLVEDQMESCAWFLRHKSTILRRNQTPRDITCSQAILSQISLFLNPQFGPKLNFSNI